MYSVTCFLLIMQSKQNKRPSEWKAVYVNPCILVETAQNDDEQNVQYKNHTYRISMASMTVFMMMNMTHVNFTPWLDVCGHLPHCILCGFTYMDCVLAYLHLFGRSFKTRDKGTGS